MRVPLVVRKSVGFICEVEHEDSEGASGEPRATGFFVCVPFTSPRFVSRRFGYFVTAAHVAKMLNDQSIFFLVNKRGGGTTTIETISTRWAVHPTDRTADVVAIPVRLNPEADMMCISSSMFVSQEDFDEERIGVGDEVFMTGLFTRAAGESRIMPIVRHGNIAMLPDEQIQTEMGYADVHLIEARSIGGLSGSPIFARTTDAGARPGSVAGMRLLGLVHGHWAINEAEINNPTIRHDRRGVNLGIAVVVPANKILETINSPEQVAWRAAMEKEFEREGIPGTDMAEDRDEEKPESFTKEDFQDALKKVSRKVE